MSSASRARDDDFQAALLGGGSILKKQVGSAVRGNDTGFMGNTEASQDVRGVLHGLPVGSGAHDDAHEGTGVLPVQFIHAPLCLSQANGSPFFMRAVFYGFFHRAATCSRCFQ